ncbi:uncharacterized protein BXZ73DRAFT_90110 [Epithele typhae]|uniref:uncharacterized protein n=1 Tax=Epithele typhae TaxID=378194 RepID=UPI002007A73B|nr:uncharacterized protein BXZ73DRAFT_90110 [Epithele typhae]KAH9931690.1 hypothetical protein BXZ73DRAFT_90110 [Epithele typhae]
MKATVAASALALCFSVAAAQSTSLYIPGFDPQQITADIEGIAADGHTTWRIGPGVTSGSFEDEPGIIGSATLVADATDAHLVYNNPTIGISLSEDCAIANGVAVCTVNASVEGGDVQTGVIVTETASEFIVQGNPTAAAATTGASTTGSPASATAGSHASSGASSTGTTSTGSTAKPTGKDNGVGGREASVALALVGAGLVSFLSL